MVDPINEVQPGQAMTAEQKAAMAKANAESSAEAHRLAAEHMAREGHGTPVVQDVAGSILEKLKTLPPEGDATNTTA